MKRNQQALCFGSQFHNPDNISADKPALIDEWGNATSYSTLRANIGNISQQLQLAGLAFDDVVAVVLPNGSANVQILIACMSQCVCAPLTSDFTLAEYKNYLTRLEARAILTGHLPDHAAVRAGLSLGIPVLTLTQEDGSLHLSELSQALPEQTHHRLPNDTALLLFSSGTTAAPKLIPLTRQNISTTAQSISNHLALTRQDCTVCVMPLFHVHGLIGSVLSTLVSGGTVVCLSEFDKTTFLNALMNTGTTWYSAVPAIHHAVLDAIQENPKVQEGHQLRFIRSSSSPLDADLMSTLESVLNVPVIEAYGMTECCHQLASNSLPPGVRKPGSVGTATNSTIVILDNNGEEVKQRRQTGQIAVTGSGLTPGYINNDASAFTDNGLLTGDLGYMDEDGYLFITDRVKDIVNRGGEKISPAEVDQHLHKHPGVADAICFGVPHETLGEILVCAIIACPDTQLTETAVREFMQSRVVPYKVPDHVVVVTELPRTMTGKPQRQALSEQFTDALSNDPDAMVSDIEQTLVTIWKSVLSTDTVGLDGNFFVLGGDSLKATRVVTAMQQAFDIQLAPTLLFNAPTVRSLADWLRNNHPAHTQPDATTQSNAAQSTEDSDDGDSSPRTQLWI